MKKKNHLGDTDRDNDVIADGQSVRVRLDLADSAQREVAEYFSRRIRTVDAIGRPNGNRPGHAFLTRDFTADSNLQDAIDAKDKAYDDCVARGQQAWRRRLMPLVDVGSDYLMAHSAALHQMAGDLENEIGKDNDEEAGFTKKWQHAYGNPTDARDGADARQVAFDALVRRSESAWRNNP